MNRNSRVAIAQETLAILNTRTYVAPSGREVSLASDIDAALATTFVIRPEEWPGILIAARASRVAAKPATIALTAETTLQAAARLAANTPGVLVLNFASAKNPGGGFLSGARAQEESLARASALYATLLLGDTYYMANRSYGSKLYTDHAVLSPAVPVFRDDAGALLESPYAISFLTIPAPNRGAIATGSADERAIPETFRRRIRFVCAVAAAQKYDTLILGAWGCGAFRNDPAEVAALFVETLVGEEGWISCFRHICFAVFDPTADAPNRRAFQQALSPVLTEEKP